MAEGKSAATSPEGERAVDTRLAQARLLVDTWCRVHNRRPEEIADMADRKLSRRMVGTLVYAIRSTVGLDIKPAADVVGMHAGTLALLQGQMLHLVDATRKNEAGRAVTSLLVAAGLETARPNSPKMPATKSGRKRTAVCSALKLAHEKALQERGEATLSSVLHLLPGTSKERVLSEEVRDKNTVEARYIAFSVLYHTVTESAHQDLIAEFFKLSRSTVHHGLRAVSIALKSDHRGEFKLKILSVCDALGIDPLKLRMK
ncbi:hypothetical protein K8R03_03955 [Candidatus Kaiserbacteria bacterium]|nr:hypothetical protein [Candidatus Kaiserbacteria bacterium]